MHDVTLWKLVETEDTQVEAPTATPDSGAVLSGTAVALSSTTPDAEIRYTLDGSTPTAASTLYTAPIAVNAAVTIKAIAVDTNSVLTDSEVATFTYTILTQVAAPTASRADGSAVLSGTEVTLSTTTDGAEIRYTLDGSTPNASSTLYAAPIAITGNTGDVTTIKAIAVDPLSVLADSAVATFAYTIRDANAEDPIADDDPIFDTALDINEAIAVADATTDVTVVGQLVYRFGNYDAVNSAILQDVISGEIVALQLFNTLSDYAIGDIVSVTGQKTTYGGVPQLQSITATELVAAAASVPLIAPQEYTSLAALLADKANLVSEVVLLKNITLGTYSSTASTTLTDSLLATLPIYRASTYPYGVEAGEIVDVLGIVSKYNTTDQIRTGTPADNGGRVIYNVVNDIKDPVITIGTPANAEVNQDYTLSVTVQDNKGVGTVALTYKVGGGADVPVTMTAAADNKYTFTIPAAEITVGTTDITFTVTATDVTGLTATESGTIAVRDVPQIVSVTPARGEITGDDKRPEISAQFKNADITATAKLTLTLNETAVLTDEAMTVTDLGGGIYKAAYTPASDLADGKYTAKVVVTRPDSQSAEYEWYFTVGESQHNLYFGQLHAHTAEYSDGSGTLSQALDYIKDYAANDNVDFVAFTDHSNHSNFGEVSTNPAPTGALADADLMPTGVRTKWDAYNNAISAFNAADYGILALAGFEMTWSGGPGHINTFNTPGMVSRVNSSINNKTGDAGLQLYYDLIADIPESISQFNHPGTTFGTFANFSYWSPDVDEVITLIEVGNGEGAVGKSGYYPSYEYYTQALDKGWHVAPTNNQDNHQGKWGNANTARSVILAEDFSEEGLYEGMRNMSAYSTEDKNLEIMYTLNNQVMGSIINTTPDSLNINVDVRDPDSTDMGGKIQVIVNGGLVAYEESYTGSTHTMSTTLSPDYSYYYIRIVQSDSDIAVTAPVWVGETSKVGITDITTATIMPVQNEEMTFETSLFNFEASDLIISKITYTETYLGTETELDATEYGYLTSGTVAAGTSEEIFTLNYTPTKAGYVTITTKIEATLDGVEYAFEKDIQFEVLDPNEVIDIAIDYGHANYYISGNYAGGDAAFIEMCAQSGVRAVALQAGELTYDNLKDMALLVLTVPNLASTGSTAVTNYMYSAAELQAIAQYAAGGGNIILCSTGDRANTVAADEWPSAITNEILAALGSDTTVAAATVVDPVRKANELYRITLGGTTEEDQKVFNYAGMAGNDLVAMMLRDVQETTNNTFSAYASAPIIPGANAEVLVSGFPTTTFSLPFDLLPTTTTLPDSYTKTTDEGSTHLMTIEELSGGGFLVVSGTTFFSTFEVKIELDNASEKQNSNYQLVQNILDTIVPEAEITDIADVQSAPEGQKFTIEGVATANSMGYDTATAFYDCMYVQDETGGINIFPTEDFNIQAGQTVRFTGYTSSYKGERQLNITGYEIIITDESINEVEPKLVTTEDAANGTYLGMLIQVSGTITDCTMSGSVVESILVEDASGKEVRVFIDGYITPDTAIENLAVGNEITVIGNSSHDDSGYRIRISDRANIVCTSVSTSETHEGYVLGYPDGTFLPNRSLSRAAAAVLLYNLVEDENKDSANVTSSMRDLTNPNAWYYHAVAYLENAGLISGYKDGTFKPTKDISRAEFVALLARFRGLDLTSPGSMVFSDVPTAHWAYNAITRAGDEGWLTGYLDGTFHPDKSITRAEMVTAVNRMLGHGTPVANIPAGCTGIFTDVKDTTKWFYKEIIEAATDHTFTLDGNGDEVWTSWNKH